MFLIRNHNDNITGDRLQCAVNYKHIIAVHTQTSQRVAIYKPEPEIGRAPADGCVDGGGKEGIILGRAGEASDLQALLREGETGQPPAGRLEAVHLGGRLYAVYAYSIEISPAPPSSWRRGAPPAFRQFKAVESDRRGTIHGL